jgi:methylenetetrahydrofolate reductase (NADPH)
MRIAELFTPGAKPVFSFEFFPPKTEEGHASLIATIRELAELSPSFVSVTYGAGGSTRERTIELVSYIKRELGIEAMAHLTCVGSSRAELSAILNRFESAKIENVIALRGDPPAGESNFRPHPDGLSHASDLVRMIREQRRPFCVAAAAYPESHVESPSPEEDLRYLVQKVDAGVDVLITQLFFENSRYFDFVARARQAGISVPIVPGIMPVTNVAQIERFTRLCGATIPPMLRERLDPARGDAEAVVRIGIEHATAQCRDLLAGGAPGVHFYTLNRSRSTYTILKQLRATLA